MSYNSEKEKIKKEAKERIEAIWKIIKITFVILAALLVLFCVTLIGTLLFSKDEDPPVIKGPDGDVVVGYVGDTPRYKQWVEVVDNEDDAPVLEINKSEVKQNEVGSYEVHYRAIDKEGNVSGTYTLTYIVKSKQYSNEKLMELIAAKAEELGITKDMKKSEQVRKIYAYVHDEVKWSGGVGESNIPNIDRNKWETDWIEEAVRTLELEEEGACEGDCYSYYSLSKAFFEYFGIENRGIKRSENYEGAKDDGTHFWSVVKVENGWYYYDATRLKHGFTEADNACLLTEKQLNSYEGDDTFYRMSKPANFPTISIKEFN